MNSVLRRSAGLRPLRDLDSPLPLCPLSSSCQGEITGTAPHGRSSAVYCRWAALRPVLRCRPHSCGGAGRKINSLICKVHGLHKNMPWLLLHSRGLVGARRRGCASAKTGTYLGRAAPARGRRASQPDLVTAHAGHFVDAPRRGELHKTCRTKRTRGCHSGAAAGAGVPAAQRFGSLARLGPLTEHQGVLQPQPRAPLFPSAGSRVPGGSCGEGKGQHQDMWPRRSLCAGTSGSHLWAPARGRRGAGRAAGTGSAGADTCPEGAGSRSRGAAGCSLPLALHLPPAWRGGTPAPWRTSPGSPGRSAPGLLPRRRPGGAAPHGHPADLRGQQGPSAPCTGLLLRARPPGPTCGQEGGGGDACGGDTRGGDARGGDAHAVGSTDREVGGHAAEVHAERVVGQSRVVRGAQEEELGGVGHHLPVWGHPGDAGRRVGSHQHEEQQEEPGALGLLVAGICLQDLRLI